MKEIINGANIQTHLDRFVDKANMHCPHYSFFGESSEALDQYKSFCALKEKYITNKFSQ